MATTAPTLVTSPTLRPDNFHNGFDTGVHYNPQPHVPMNHHPAAPQPPSAAPQGPHHSQEPQHPLQSTQVNPNTSNAPLAPAPAPTHPHHHHSLSAPIAPLSLQTSGQPSPPSGSSGVSSPGAQQPQPHHQHHPSLPQPPPHLQLPLRKCRQPKSPLYVPAVLRPTERPGRQSPPKPCSGLDSATDGSPPKSAVPSSPESTRSLFPFLPRSAGGVEGRRHGFIERRDTAGSLESNLSRVVGDEWNEEALGKVTGPPTRNHWKPDPSSPTCNSPTCATPFTLFTRRHHCRRCGHIFCGTHSTAAVPLDQHARFHPRGGWHRACDGCWRDYCVWESVRSRGNSEMGSDGSESLLAGDADGRRGSREGDVVGEGIEQDERAVKGGVKIGTAATRARQEGRFGSLSQSFGREWTWSTF